jgi:hypothetical protein
VESLSTLLIKAKSISENSNFVYAILRNKKRFEALRTFTLESGQAEIERRSRRHKENSSEGSDSLELSSRTSADSLRSPVSGQRRALTLSNVPEEESAFAIGDDDDDDTDDDAHPTPAHSTPTERPSRPSSVASSVDDTVPRQTGGLSEKARGKMPAGTPTFSRQNSMTSLGGYSAPGMGPSGSFEPTADWIETWLPELPLHTILTLIEQVSPLISRTSVSPDAVPTSILRSIQEAQVRGIDPSPIRIHSFEWSPLSLGWYESLLWSFIFMSEMQVAKGTVGIWNGTAIKLFRVQETAPEGPTLTSPRGAVDAVGSNIVSRIGSINLRGQPLANIQTTQQGGGGGNHGGGGNSPAVRSAVV